MQDKSGFEIYQGRATCCPNKATNVYLCELLNISFELEKKLRNGEMSEQEARIVYDIMTEIRAFFEATREDWLNAERKTERE